MLDDAYIIQFWRKNVTHRWPESIGEGENSTHRTEVDVIH
jgi:hypothetical protein